MKVINELRKLLSVKAIWIIYLMLVVFVLTTIRDHNAYNEFSSIFVENYGTGPYDLDLINDYINLDQEITACRGEKYTYETCDQVLGGRSKELRNIYPSMSYRDLKRGLDLFNNGGDYVEPIYYITLSIENQKLMDKTIIEDYFFQKMVDYHTINPRMLDVLNNKVYNSYAPSNDFHTYMVLGGIISIFMMIFSIASNHSQQDVDMIVLSSKTGRRIIKHKISSALIFSVISSILCFIPLILLQINNNTWVYVMNGKMIEPVVRTLYWFDFRLWQYLLVVFVLSVIANSFISMMISVISIYSKKIMNIIAYNLVLIAGIIGLIVYFELKDSPTVFSQIIRISLNHTPYGLIYNNIGMMQYHSYGSAYLTYREFPFVFIGLNTIVVLILLYMGCKHYKKMNL